MNITVNQHQFFVDDRGKRIIRSRDGRCCAAASICEFSMQIQSGEQQYALTPEQFSKTPMPDGARYENSILQVQLRYAPRGSAIAKKLSVTAKQPLTLLYMQTEYSRFDEPLRGGGEGQPVFAANDCFAASTLPVALTRVLDGSCLSIEQSPWKTLQAGETFLLHDVIFGFAEGAGIEASFVAWLRSQRRRPEGRRIFCDWGAHDELAGEAQLDEAMAMRLAGLLAHGAEHGMAFDSYLMDAYWFEEHIPAPADKDDDFIRWPGPVSGAAA